MDKIKKMTYCATKVQGRTYQELDERAREYGARFFELPIERISVFIVEDARPVAHAKHGDGEPEMWAAKFRIGCEVEADDDPDPQDDTGEDLDDE